ncbi:unnamed protein product [Acanthoscelides obtectus]|uniref:Uncharacterized protein n=1 Tax=Acanthoscelides obtectus TaxID=200917 RepID=A0A9P0PN67_ACAOB|nr:unnamed protein product [Acanthoscelides obtectus]CAK1664586.1 hypothetical protein AOBTE_LOCUS24349 [Acanthoscelides obtectus]
MKMFDSDIFIGILQQSESALGKIPRSRSRVLGHLLEKMRPGSMQERERSKSAGQTDKPTLSAAPAHKPQVSQFKKPFMSSSQQINIDRLEAQIKEKLHDIISRRQSSQPASKSDTETGADRKMSKDDRKLSKTDLDSIARLGTGKQRIMYKKIGKSCDKINGGMGSGGGSKSDSECKKALRGGGAAGGEQPDYQRISDACGGGGMQQGIIKGGALIHGSRSSPSSPKGGKGRGGMQIQGHHQHRGQQQYQGQTGGGGNQAQAGKQHRKKIYPYSDGEDNVFYGTSRGGCDSADSLSGASSRRSSYDGGGGGGGGGTPPTTDKTLVVVINRRNKSVSSAGGGSTPTSAQAQKQRSWETFPPKRRHHHAPRRGSEKPSSSCPGNQAETERWQLTDTETRDGSRRGRNSNVGLRIRIYGNDDRVCRSSSSGALCKWRNCYTIENSIHGKFMHFR